MLLVILYAKITESNFEMDEKDMKQRVVVELTPQKNKRIKDGKKHNTKNQKTMWSPL